MTALWLAECATPQLHFFAGQGYQACNLYWSIGLPCPWHEEPRNPPLGYFGSGNLSELRKQRGDEKEGKE